MKENELSHRIAKSDEDALMAYVQEALDRKDERSEKIAVALSDFAVSNATVHSKRYAAKENRQAKRLTYATLPDFLRCCGMTYKEAMEVISGRELKWYSDEAAELCACLEKMPEEQLDCLGKLFWSMIPKDYKELYDLSELRCYRIQKLISYRSQDRDFGKLLAEKYGLPKVWKLAQREAAVYNSFTIAMLPILSEEGHVGLHWLMGLDESMGILSASGKAETVMDRYCFLPRETQRILYESITGKEGCRDAEQK